MLMLGYLREKSWREEEREGCEMVGSGSPFRLGVRSMGRFVTLPEKGARRWYLSGSPRLARRIVPTIRTERANVALGIREMQRAAVPEFRNRGSGQIRGEIGIPIGGVWNRLQSRHLCF